MNGEWEYLPGGDGVKDASTRGSSVLQEGSGHPKFFILPATFMWKENPIIIKAVGAFSIVKDNSTVFVNRKKVVEYVIENSR